MPELPEVETIVRGLREEQGIYHASITGCRITRAEVLWERTVANMNSESFQKQIHGQLVNSISRRGKFLVFSMERDAMLIHLRMSGDIRVEETVTDTQTHDRMILEFENGLRMVFNDTRKFGRVWLVSDPKEVLGVLGPEPRDKNLTGEEFHRMLSERSRQLKPLLMDQHFLAGLGNIYTDEALHLAQIHPLTQSDTLTLEESSRLLRAIRAVLSEGIRRNGASIDWVYRGGDFQNQLRAYGREGEPCPVCGEEIIRLVVGQRGTHICPDCQQLK